MVPPPRPPPAWAAGPARREPGDLLGRHGLLRAGVLTAMGVDGAPDPVAGDWLADPSFWRAARSRLAELTRQHAEQDPLAVGLPVEAARRALGLPDRILVEALAREQAGVSLHDGYLTVAPGEVAAAPVPGPLLTAVRAVRSDLAGDPFRAPEAARLRELGLDTKAIAAAARAGLLLRVSDQVVLAPGADRRSGPGAGRAAAAVHHRRSPPGPRYHPAGGHPAAGVPGPGPDHRAAAR